MFALVQWMTSPWMAPDSGLCLLWTCQQIGPETGTLQERPHQSLVQKLQRVPRSNPSIFFSWTKWSEEKIQAHISKMTWGNFPFCLKWSLSPGMNRLLLWRKNKPKTNSFSCIFRIRAFKFMGTWHWVFAGSWFYKLSPRLLKLQSFLSRLKKWLTLSYTLSPLLSQGKGLLYTLLAFQNNILPRKVSQNTQDFFSLYFLQSKQLSSENLQYLYIIKKKVCNFGKVENLFYYYLKINLFI